MVVLDVLRATFGITYEPTSMVARSPSTCATPSYGISGQCLRMVSSTRWIVSSSP
ncbi:hypothetical protein [Branchiibius hedensis]|uniref:hypothetical protein n=1 Tax=Branchiibius hedensis TaxID=672460 RepID=UPI0014757B1D|nr:hypothetical protein [Branchiibius hedensis]